MISRFIMLRIPSTVILRQYDLSEHVKDNTLIIVIIQFVKFMIYLRRVDLATIYN